MGPSGSGKTTLLDILAGRKTTGTIEGEVLFAATKPSTNFLRRFTGYVEQFDTLLDILTVREMLLYTAELKRPVKVRSQLACQQCSMPSRRWHFLTLNDSTLCRARGDARYKRCIQQRWPAGHTMLCSKSTPAQSSTFCQRSR